MRHNEYGVMVFEETGEEVLLAQLGPEDVLTKRTDIITTGTFHQVVDGYNNRPVGKLIAYRICDTGRRTLVSGTGYRLKLVVLEGA